MAKRSTLFCSYRHQVLRNWQSTEAVLTKENFVYPILVHDKPDVEEPLEALPALTRYGCNRLEAHVGPLVDKGLTSVLIFGVLQNLSKDVRGSNADSENAPAMQAIRKLRSAFPNILIIADVCICSYTSTGHCGICCDNGDIDIDASVKRLAEISVNFAKAGCDVIAPSSMMDGRVAAIKSALKENGFGNKIPVLSYSAKFRSFFYGPFLEATKSCLPKQDKKMYHLPPASSGIAHRALKRDIDEGADMLMVKPSFAYTDILRDAKTMFPDIPLAVYQVSGEYAMLLKGAEEGLYNLDDGVLEVMTGLRRAGADIIITYFAPYVLDWLSVKK
ncbi:uncharacterized protein TRIADDRAFT_50678 [Trichoplax adhaerens]|uniref:Delta-aminolevulinic acid dehydratase n=1 Tax=Trichoplax adhaerens TaxID=10228 RepID=B3S5A4_TRIAD|nr:hypothetical protein TRIADDRAFT_50678 [Trichoplax adhaerens]EDV22229.1 hypothetical protein TRIADDRAFT_50678 [Trichoplax adhaerens]|eukprot:XP_002115384.1 hypothetical protein TRIADDRAFT_50678 [Trichoplax adhaerens]